MSAQVALRAHLNELLDNAAKDRVDEAPEAWANLEKLVRSGSQILLSRRFGSLGTVKDLDCHHYRNHAVNVELPGCEVVLQYGPPFKSQAK